MARSADTSGPAAPLSIAAVAGDPAWLAHRYDPGHDAVHFRHVPRKKRARAAFLSDDCLDPGEPIVVRRTDARAAAPPAAPIHFVFHSAFCLSTLVARAFDRPGCATTLKEPTIFHDIVGWRRRGGQGPDMAEVLNDALALLARPFGAGEAVIVKPSNIVCGIMPAMLALRPEARALCLHAPLRTFLASIASKGMWGRLWVRTLLVGLLDDRLVDLGFGARDHLGQTDLQVAAVGWLVQQAQFAALAGRFGHDRVRTLESGTLLDDPAGAMAALARHFRLTLATSTVAEIVAGPAFTRHSKLDTAFAAADRAGEHRDAAAVHGDEIEKVAVWAEAVAAAAGVATTLDAPLLG